MAIDVKNKFKTFLPGAGRDSSGNPVQRKRRVVGEIACTYTKGGETLNPADVHLETIDWIDMKIKNAVTGPNPGQGTREVFFADDSNQFYCSRTRIAAGPAELADGSVIVIKYVAEGDAADAPELR